MEFKIKLSTFKDYLKRLNFSVKTISGRIEFTGILITAHDNHITFECRNDSTDMKIVEKSSKIKIIEPGKVLIKGSTLNEIVQKMEGDDCLVTKVDSNLAIIQSKDSKYKINLLKDENYEKAIFNIGPSKEVTIPGKIFKNSINKVLFAGNEEHQRFIFRGMNLSIYQGLMTTTVCDGIRIASYIEKVSSDTIINKTIPLKVTSELSKILPDNANYIFSFSDRKGMVVANNITLQFYLIEGTFPVFRKHFEESSYNKELTVDKNLLFNSIEKATILSKHKTDASNRIEFLINKEYLKLSTSEQEVGSADVTIKKIKYEGEAIKFSISSKLVYEGLRAIDAKDVTIFLNEPGSSVYIKTKNNDLNYLVSPMQ